MSRAGYSPRGVEEELIGFNNRLVRKSILFSGQDFSALYTPLRARFSRKTGSFLPFNIVMHTLNRYSDTTKGIDYI